VSGGGGVFLNRSNIEAALNKQQPGDSPRTTKQNNNSRLNLGVVVERLNARFNKLKVTV